MKVNGQWVPCVRNSSYSFMPIHLKLYMCYGHGMKICMWFGYNSWIIFCHYTPGIYANGYIVFAFPFVCSLVRSLVRSLFRNVLGIYVKVFVKVSLVVYIS